MVDIEGVITRCIKNRKAVWNASSVLAVVLCNHQSYLDALVVYDYTLLYPFRKCIPNKLK